MEVRVTLEHLRAGEKPLAMFLHDALRSINEQYFESIVASYARNARPSSQPSDSSSNSHRDKVLDERGRLRTSLEQFDLTFQLNLFETLLGTVRAGYSDEGIPQDIRTTFKSSLHLRGDTLYKVIALRKYRNDVVHHHLDRGDIAATIGELGKVLDVFRGELLTCCKSQPDVFTQATVSSIQAYVDTIVNILTDVQATQQRVETTLVYEQAQPVVPEERLFEPEQAPASRKLIYALGGVTVLIAVIVALVFQTPSDSQSASVSHPTKSLVLVVSERLPQGISSEFSQSLFRRTLDSQSVYRVAVIRHGEPNVTIQMRLDPISVQSNLVPLLTSAQSVPKVEELTALFNSLIAVHSDTLMHRLASTIYLLGNMPEITRAEHLQLDAKVGPNGENAINVLDISNDRDVFKRLKIDAFKMLCYRAPTQTDSLIQHVLQRDINGLNVGLGRL